MLRHKLILTEKAIRNGCHLHCEKDADKIKKCVFILNRLIKDDYFEMALTQHDKKWGKGKFRTEQIKDDPKYYSLHVDYENVKTKEDEKNERRDFRNASQLSAYLREQDKELLFKIMRKHIDTWWD
jgi:hypothetical protein